jgi:hypothetical protein
MPRLTTSIPKHFICWDVEQAMHLFVATLSILSPIAGTHELRKLYACYQGGFLLLFFRIKAILAVATVTIIMIAIA